MTKFEHHAFVIGLGFVAGFVDVFGFTHLGSLLPAHITGNLIFLAIYLAHGRHQVLMFVAALPIFCVVGSAWMIGYLAERKRDPFLPALLVEAGLMLCGMLCLITVVTDNLTQVLSDTVAYVCRFPSISHTKRERVILERQAKRMLLTGT